MVSSAKNVHFILHSLQSAFHALHGQPGVFSKLWNSSVSGFSFSETGVAAVDRRPEGQQKVLFRAVDVQAQGTRILRPYFNPQAPSIKEKLTVAACIWSPSKGRVEIGGSLGLSCQLD